MKSFVHKGPQRIGAVMYDLGSDRKSLKGRRSCVSCFILTFTSYRCSRARMDRARRASTPDLLLPFVTYNVPDLPPLTVPKEPIGLINVRFFVSFFLAFCTPKQGNFRAVLRWLHLDFCGDCSLSSPIDTQCTSKTEIL